MIMGLDISTSITGIAVLDNTGEVVICDAWDLRKYKGFFLKVEKTKNLLKTIEETQNIEKIFIEESLQSFRTGFSSAQTLSTLARFNGTLSWLCYEMFSIEPEFVGATTARKLCGIKVPRGRKAKEVVLENILDIDPSFVIDYTKHGNPKPGTYDRADSLVIARAGYELCKQESSNS
jgi:hypothetical protein|tara:strand:+ start:1675 stop:2205 length:531 start_codon:yes stop_codon:yes gene_type:complete